MDPLLRAVLAVCMRWIHITSVVTLHRRLHLCPLRARPGARPRCLSPPAARSAIAPSRISALCLYTVLVTILGSGLYNYLTKPSYPPHYHMWIGIKFLFVTAHFRSVAILYTIPGAGEPKRKRWLTGMVISGLIIIAISNYLRWISLK